MKRTFLTLSLLSILTLGFSQNYGFACEDAIHVGYNYMKTLNQGTYWFTSNTNYLPLTLYYIPDNEYIQEPEIWLDFTCVEGYYDNPKVENMIRQAGNYDLSFPMKEKLEETEYEGKFAYRVHFNESYRDMLYGQGVTYPIDAFVKVVSAGNATLQIVSESVHQECASQAMALKMNSTLNVVPADTTNVFIWPIGEWIEQDYQVSWTGSPVDIYIGQDCQVESIRRVWKKLSFKGESALFFDKKKTTEWIQDAYSPELYMRIYTSGEGSLSITPYKVSEHLQSALIEGTYAVIDNENLTITATLPKGTNLATALNNAQYQPAVSPITGDAPKIINRSTQLRYGNIVYKLNITIAADEMSHDATLRYIYFDEDKLEAFIPSQTNYDSIGLEYAGATITVMTNNHKAKTEISGTTNDLPSTVTITVTAEAGDKLTYTLHLYQAPSQDASLYRIRVNGEDLVGFSPDTYLYRLSALSIPKVRAIANDKNAKVVIQQAKSVPGVARIRVEAEAGNVTYYSIIVDKDPRLDECSSQTSKVQLGQPIQIVKKKNETFAISTNDLKNKNISISWSGHSPLDVQLSSACQEDETNAIFASYHIIQEKGRQEYAGFFIEDTVISWIEQSIDSYVYLHINAEEDGVLTLRPFDTNCYSIAPLWDLPSQQYIANNSFNRVYKIYLPDWQNKDTEITWQGNSTLEIFFADTCHFLLQATNIHLLAEGYKALATGEKITISKDIVDGWAKSAGDFAYIRLLNAAEGNINISVLKDYNDKPIEQKHYQLKLISSAEDAGLFVVKNQATQTTIEGDIIEHDKWKYSILENSVLSIEAIANEHYTFRSWNDGNATNPRTINMNTDKELTAYFTPNRYTVSVTCDLKQGQVSGSGTYKYLQEVTIEARPRRGYKFYRWSDDNEDNPRVIIVSADMNIEALFQNETADTEQTGNTSSLKTQKYLLNNSIYILMPNGKTYNILGQERK